MNLFSEYLRRVRSREIGFSVNSTTINKSSTLERITPKEVLEQIVKERDFWSRVLSMKGWNMNMDLDVRPEGYYLSESKDYFL